MPEKAPTRILIADDSPVYRRLVSDCVRSFGFEPVAVADGKAAWQILRRADTPRLVLLDWVLPGHDGIELCRRIREHADQYYSYIVLLTGKDGQKHMLEAMRAGADDYIVKPFDDALLEARLLVGKRILDLHEKLLAAQECMRHAATHDWLTGLLNRGEAMAALERELERGRREKTSVGVLLADIDHFKSVNDTLGHLFGDEALREVGRRFRAGLRLYDTVGRFGGEEFLLVLPGCDSVTTIVRADDLRSRIARQAISLSSASRTITISVGATVAPHNSQLTLGALLDQADRALYTAKQNGRNRVECLDDMPPDKSESPKTYRGTQIGSSEVQ